MHVLHLVAADRWTGAAATALQLVEALRARGVEARLAFRVGRNLEERLRGIPWAHPVLHKERSLAGLRASVATVRALARGCSIVHAHLPHDHALARLALGASGPPVVRSLRHLKHLRRDPFHRWLFRRTAGTALANSAMTVRLSRLPALNTRPSVVLPPAVEARFARMTPAGLRAAGAATRSALGIPAEAVVAGAVGKLDRDRGHDLLLRAAASAPGVWTLLVGHGPTEEGLRRLARRLGVDDRTSFAGYVDEGLERHYAAMDLFVFPAAGSDHGHRAIVEAAGCGVPALAADAPGVLDLLLPGVTGDVWAAADAAALGVLLRRWAADATLRAAARAAALRRSAGWTPERLADTAIAVYDAVLTAAPRRR